MERREGIERRNSKSFQNGVSIFNGRAMIYTTDASNGVYQFRTWVNGENRYVRESLRTRERAEATVLAENRYLEIKSDIAAGRKIFSITVAELIERFLEEQSKRVQTGKITIARLGTIKTQLKRHFAHFVGGDKTLVSSLSQKSFHDYAQYRRLKNTDVREVTLRNEQTTIGALIKNAFRNGHIGFEKAEFEEIKIREIERRDTFTFEEYEELYRFMRKWVGDTFSEKEKVNRQFIRDFILIGANTFLRFGELRNLRWRNIKVKTVKRQKKESEEMEELTLVQIDLEAAITKNRKSRTLLARGGAYFERIRSYSRHASQEDYVFVDNESGGQLSKKLYYKYWQELMKGAEIEIERRNLTYYSLRHFGITARMVAGVSVYDVSKMAGTSVGFISNFYEHMDMAKMVETATKTVRRDEYGMFYRD